MRRLVAQGGPSAAEKTAARLAANRQPSGHDGGTGPWVRGAVPRSRRSRVPHAAMLRLEEGRQQRVDPQQARAGERDAGRRRCQAALVGEIAARRRASRR